MILGRDEFGLTQLKDVPAASFCLLIRFDLKARGVIIWSYKIIVRLMSLQFIYLNKLRTDEWSRQM